MSNAHSPPEAIERTFRFSVINAMFLTVGNVLEDKQISLAMFLVEANGYAEDANRILSSELRMINKLQKKKGLNRG